jgi:hypothetical protein
LKDKTDDWAKHTVWYMSQFGVKCWAFHEYDTKRKRPFISEMSLPNQSWDLSYGIFEVL